MYLEVPQTLQRIYFTNNRIFIVSIPLNIIFQQLAAALTPSTGDFPFL